MPWDPPRAAGGSDLGAEGIPAETETAAPATSRQACGDLLLLQETFVCV